MSIIHEISTYSHFNTQHAIVHSSMSNPRKQMFTFYLDNYKFIDNKLIPIEVNRKYYAKC